MSTHSTVVGYLLWILGIFGVHRLYFGKRVTGLLYLLCAAVLSVGLWVDPFAIPAAGVAYTTLAGLVAACLVADLFLIPRIRRQMSRAYQAGRYNYSVAWLLLVLGGVLGLHRFYAGKWGSGLLFLCTLGGLGVGIVYDLLTFNELLSITNERWISGDAALGVT
jgi:TM2 domain-containing membrane protein YozV